MQFSTISKFGTRGLSAVALASALVLAACGGGGGDDAGSSNNNSGGSGSAPVLTGQVYPVVQGLSYRTETQKGVVSADGSFTYRAGELVTLSLSGVDLITAPGAAKMSALQLDDDEVAELSARLLRTLDADSNLANGAQVPELPTTNITPIDLSDATAVAGLAAQVKPGATLASADAQVTTAVTSAKATAAANAGTYGTSYQGFHRSGTNCSYAYATNASVQLTGQPNWTTRALTGTMVVTLSDSTTQTLNLTQTTGTMTTSAATFNYTLAPSNNAAGSRVMKVTFTSTASPSCPSVILMRDPAQANVKPIAAVVRASVAPGLTTAAFDTYTYETAIAGPLGIGSKDLDGRVVSLQWRSSKGKTGSADLFSETVAPGEDVTFTLTVTDDQGAVGVNTWTVSRKALTVDQALALVAGRTWKEDRNYNGYDYYYRLTSDRQTFIEYEVRTGTTSCRETDRIDAQGVAAGIDVSKLVFSSNTKFSYTEGTERSSFTQVGSVPGGC